MKQIVLTLFVLISLISCSDGKKRPDVSDIKVDLEIQRFEQDLFQLDTLNMEASFQNLNKKYPTFLNDFMGNILGVPLEDPQAMYLLKQYIKEFQPIYVMTMKNFADFSMYRKEISAMLRYVKHYFPTYAVPKKVITFVGPLDAFYQNSMGWSGDIITREGLGVGLQLHLGKESPIYMEAEGSGYPAYISRRFDPEYISVNAAKNIIDDLFPIMKEDQPLIDQLIDKGKRLYVLDRLLPDTPDTLKIGYTAVQLEACEKNEALIWNYFLQNNLLFESDFQKIKPYLTDSPKTEELGDESPGFIGLFVGKKIVEAFMEKHPETTLPQLLEYNSRKLFEESRYKAKRQ